MDKHIMPPNYMYSLSTPNTLNNYTLTPEIVGSVFNLSFFFCFYPQDWFSSIFSHQIKSSDHPFLSSFLFHGPPTTIRHHQPPTAVHHSHSIYFLSINLFIFFISSRLRAEDREILVARFIKVRSFMLCLLLLFWFWLNVL